MAENLQNNLFDANIDIKAKTTGLDTAASAIDKLTAKITNLQKNAKQIESAFSQLFKSSLSGVDIAIRKYEELNRQIAKYGTTFEAFGRTSNNIRVTNLSGFIPTASVGENAFAQQRDRILREQQLNEQRRLNRHQWARWGMSKVNSALGAYREMGGQFANADFTGMVASGYGRVGQALGILGGPVLIYKSIRKQLLKSLLMNRANEYSTMLGVQGLAGSENAGNQLLFRGVGYGYGNQETAQAAENFLRSGGRGINARNIQSQMHFARAYGINLNQVAQFTGEFERYGDRRSGISQLRDVANLGRRGGVRQQNIGEFIQSVAQVWKETVADGIKIKNPNDIATSMARMEKAGIVGVQAQRTFASMNEMVRSSANLQSYGDYATMRDIMQYRRKRGMKMGYFDIGLQTERGMTDMSNYQALREGLISRYGRIDENTAREEILARLPGNAANKFTRATQIARLMSADQSQVTQANLDRINRNENIRHVSYGIAQTTQRQDLYNKSILYDLSGRRGLMDEAQANERQSRNLIKDMFNGDFGKFMQHLMGASDKQMTQMRTTVDRVTEVVNKVIPLGGIVKGVGSILAKLGIVQRDTSNASQNLNRSAIQLSNAARAISGGRTRTGHR